MKKLITCIAILGLIVGIAVPFSIFAVSQVGGNASSNLVLTDDLEGDYGIKVDKSLEKDSNGNYQVKIEAYGTGSQTIINKGKPTDIVLVLDISGSMEQNKLGDITRLEALQNVVTDFIGSVAANNPEHRISLVTFASDGNMINDLLKVGENEDALVDNVESLDAGGWTRPDEGMDLAKGILDRAKDQEDENPDIEKREKVVVMFTDGEPTTARDGGYFSWTTANNTISTAKSIKNDYDARVFTVALIDGADPENGINTLDSYFYINRFMHLTSSNYKSASSLSYPGSGSNAGYYMSADSQEALANIFESISETIGGSETQLDETTEIVDQLSEYFALPEGTSSGNLNGIKAYSRSYSGDNQWGEAVDITSQMDIDVDEHEGTVTAKGFSFSDNWVGTITSNGSRVYRGKKLVITIPVEPIDGFIGGNQVPSNGSKSGVYLDGDQLGELNYPTADLEINHSFQTDDETIYLTNDADLGKLVKNPLEYYQGENHYTIDGKVNGFVNIKYVFNSDEGDDYTYSIPAGETTGSWEGDGDKISPSECKKFTIKTIIVPNKTGTIQGRTSTSTSANIHVLVPKITAHDKTIYWGEGNKINLNSQVSVSDEWKDQGQHQDYPEVKGDKPNFQFEFTRQDTLKKVDSFQTYDPSEDLVVEVTPKIGATDITNQVDAESDLRFNILVKYCTLEVEKIGSVDDDQSFIFDIQGPMDIKASIAIKGNGIQKFVGLPIGYYLVTENSDWSFRYTPSEPEIIIGLIAMEPDGKVVFNNTKSKYNWLSGDCFKRNIMTILQEETSGKGNHR